MYLPKHYDEIKTKLLQKTGETKLKAFIKKIVNRIKTYVPLFSRVFFCIGLVALCIHITCLCSETFADFYIRNIGAFFRGLLAHLTGWIPFSLAETVVIGIPVIIFAMLMFWINTRKKSDREATRGIFALISIITLFYSTFVFGYGMGYHGTSLASKLSLEEKPVSAEELKYTAERLDDEINKLLPEITFTDSGASVMPYSLDEMNDRLNTAYKKASEKYSFIQDLKSKLKYIALSEPMTYTHISGVYSYYTGEANININFPDYTLPYTAAHELAHQRGIAPENEANFVAFLVCLESDDPYIKYSAYTNMYEYITNALYSADRTMYAQVVGHADYKFRNEMVAFSVFFEKYRNSAASEVSDAINDTYLKIQGQSQGSKSYGIVVDLAVAYYKNN